GGTGTFGSLSVDADSGQWIYTLDSNDPDTEALGPGDVAFDTFTITASDGQSIDTAEITITVNGADEPAPVIDLTSLSSAQGFIISGEGAFNYAGFSVASAGDLNGDGYADLIVGAPNSTFMGQAYVVFGSAGGFGVAETIGDAVRQVIEITSLNSAQGFV